MKLNTDLRQRVVIDSTALPWRPSPADGVARRLLERDGVESGRATSIVRYEPGSAFSRHSHPGGEEFIVLEGQFEDEHGRYPAGTYVKNPPGSAHSPGSPGGCTLLVKLHHLDEDDTERIVMRPSDRSWREGLVEGLHVLPLSQSAETHTALVRWAPGTRFTPHRHVGGEEIFVLEGTFQDEFGNYPTGTWIRNPHLSMHRPYSIDGCLILVKVGHLMPGTPQHADARDCAVEK